MKKLFLPLLATFVACSSSFAQSQVINSGWTTQQKNPHPGIHGMMPVDLQTQNHSARISTHIDQLERAGSARIQKYAFRLDERREAAEKRFLARTGLPWKAQIRTLNARVEMNNLFSDRGGVARYVKGYTASDEPLVVMLNPQTSDGSCGTQLVLKDEGQWTKGTLYRFWVVESIARCGNDNSEPIIGAEEGVTFCVPTRQIVRLQPPEIIREVVKQYYAPPPQKTPPLCLPPLVASWNGETHASGSDFRYSPGGSITLVWYHPHNKEWKTSPPLPPVVCTDAPPTDVAPPGSATPPPAPPNPVEGPKGIKDPGVSNTNAGPGNGGHTPISKPPPTEKK